MEFTINSEFEKLIPPLSQDERAGLEALLLADGIQSPLIIARYPSPEGEEILHLADGHNRYRIAEKHGLKYNTITQDFASEDDVVIWMVDNQKGRRNLTDFVKLELAEVKAERLRKKGRGLMSEARKAAWNKEGLSIVDKPIDPHNTRNEIAADLNWSTGKVAMGQKIIKEAPEEIKEQLRKNEISINQVYTQLTKPHVANNSGENEWYTPAQYVESARRVMGSIDLDPASSEIANKRVGATTIFTKDDDGLSMDWFGNIWMNPPYAQPLISQFIEKLTANRTFEQAIVLVNNATETQWGQMLLRASDAVCFHQGRIRFIDPFGVAGQAPLQGQMICYIGENKTAFMNEFTQYGTCF